MNYSRATVSKILTYSCVDGPGNRLVIFLQGCNFNCPSCHNPHTIGRCNHCGDCIPACHASALSLQSGRVVWLADACDQCDDCLTVCPISASPMTREYTVAEMLEVIRENRAFLGGITVSGGEATLQMKFVAALFGAVKADPELADLTCFIDTNGNLGPKSWDRLLPVTDGVMLDIKALDNDLHLTLTGQVNRKVLRTAEIVHTAGKLYELRFLMIPDRTDSMAELDQLIGFVHALGTDVRVKLNAFQHHGVRGQALNWPKMTEARIDAAATRLNMAGIANVITPALYM